MQRGRGGLNVRDLRCGVLELARTSGTLAVITVIERESDESALGKGAGPGSKPVLCLAIRCASNRFNLLRPVWPACINPVSPNIQAPYQRQFHFQGVFGLVRSVGLGNKFETAYLAARLDVDAAPGKTRLVAFLEWGASGSTEIVHCALQEPIA
jgi:hypothetical protein